MKRLKIYLMLVFILLVGSYTFSSCSSSNDSKAKKVVVEYLKENLDDFKSYTPVSWGELKKCSIDSLKKYDTYYNTQLNSLNYALEYKEKLQTIITSYKQKGNCDSTDYLEAVAQLEGVIARCKRDQKNLSNYVNSYPNEWWTIKHKYRVKNVAGAFILKEEDFKIDNELSKVIDIAILVDTDLH